MSRFYDPDDLAPCPGCSELVLVTLLCEHDDPDTGPLCVDICCPRTHDEGPVAA